MAIWPHARCVPEEGKRGGSRDVLLLHSGTTLLARFPLGWVGPLLQRLSCDTRAGTKVYYDIIIQLPDCHDQLSRSETHSPILDIFSAGVEVSATDSAATPTWDTDSLAVTPPMLQPASPFSRFLHQQPVLSYGILRPHRRHRSQ